MNKIEVSIVIYLIVVINIISSGCVNNDDKNKFTITGEKDNTCWAGKTRFEGLNQQNSKYYPPESFIKTEISKEDYIALLHSDDIRLENYNPVTIWSQGRNTSTDVPMGSHGNTAYQLFRFHISFNNVKSMDILWEGHCKDRKLLELNISFNNNITIVLWNNELTTWKKIGNFNMTNEDMLIKRTISKSPGSYLNNSKFIYILTYSDVSIYTDYIELKIDA